MNGEEGTATVSRTREVNVWFAFGNHKWSDGIVGRGKSVWKLLRCIQIEATF